MKIPRSLRSRYFRTDALVFSVLLCLPGLLFAQDSPPPPPNGPGQALFFDGVNDRLIADPFALPSGNDPYTIEAWINPTTMHSESKGKLLHPASLRPSLMQAIFNYHESHQAS